MKVIVIGSNFCWGRADTLAQAMKNANRPKHYVAFSVSDETTVSPIDGGLSWPQGDPEPVKIAEKLPRKAVAK